MPPTLQSSPASPASANLTAEQGPIRVQRPKAELVRPVIFSSPHSGRRYEEELQRRTILPLEVLRRSEDAYVDELIECATEFGASTLMSDCPRVFVDVNRSSWELDQRMFSDRLPAHADTRSRRAVSGLGVVPRVAADGRHLYRSRLRVADAKDLLGRYYTPYHHALSELIDDVQADGKGIVIADTHSMPEHSARGVDFVLGDRFGQSCHPAVTRIAEGMLKDRGFVTVRNTPYAGGYTTEHYGRPDLGVNVIQIEISRGLYLDENRVVKSPEFTAFADEFRSFIKNFTCIDWGEVLST
jgi:N-formylglutamate amidohydrolase